ncbi:hypothetical protein B0H16DRAFT_1484253 [Mycena metata]|uniref:Uncharacterized protein n=1 Tax=Mycena metata TaxID=1033252 RepID=A0AAD7DVU2_9AGAR|nr:hypothetical protein B0H16DRAFT_1484253 [Mycena metata]
MYSNSLDVGSIFGVPRARQGAMWSADMIGLHFCSRFIFESCTSEGTNDPLSAVYSEKPFVPLNTSCLLEVFRPLSLTPERSDGMSCSICAFCPTPIQFSTSTFTADVAPNRRDARPQSGRAAACINTFWLDFTLRAGAIPSHKIFAGDHISLIQILVVPKINYQSQSIEILCLQRESKGRPCHNLDMVCGLASFVRACIVFGEACDLVQGHKLFVKTSLQYTPVAETGILDGFLGWSMDFALYGMQGRGRGPNQWWKMGGHKISGKRIGADVLRFSSLVWVEFEFSFFLKYEMQVLVDEDKSRRLECSGKGRNAWVRALAKPMVKNGWMNIFVKERGRSHVSHITIYSDNIPRNRIGAEVREIHVTSGEHSGRKKRCNRETSYMLFKGCAMNT